MIYTYTDLVFLTTKQVMWLYLKLIEILLKEH